MKACTVRGADATEQIWSGMSQYLTLINPRDAERYYREGLWAEDTLYGLLLRQAAERPDAVALRDAHGSRTWSELVRWVDGIAADLDRHGLRAGDRVSIWMSSRSEAIGAFLACARQGFACNPSLHRTYTVREIGGLLDRLSARAIFTEDGWGADRNATNLDVVLSRVESLRLAITPDTFPRPADNPTPWSQDPDRVVYLAFTSGTTGQPKCVMHSSNTLLANARDLVRDWNHGPETVMLTLSPVSHHIAWVAVAQWLLTGGTLVVGGPPEGMNQFDWIVETGATYVLGVPTHALDVLAQQKERKARRLGAVKTFYMAGAAIPPALAQAFLDQGVMPQNVYGMTENSSHQYTHPEDDAETIVGSCGKGGRAYDVRIFDPVDPDRQLKPGEAGEIGGRGAALMLGYFGNQSATERSFNADGWFLSGDLGTLDAAGNLRVVGRLKEVIIRGGHNIYPNHIEDLAQRHDEVTKAACFPVPDERLGERACLAVIGTAHPQSLIQHLSCNGLSKFDLPEFFVRLDAFPLTASGKILKRELTEMVKRGELRPQALRIEPAMQRMSKARH